MHIKHVDGNITHIITPMVEPTRPSTNSMFGIKMPISNDVITIAAVNILNFCSGI